MILEQSFIAVVALCAATPLRPLCASDPDILNRKRTYLLWGVKTDEPLAPHLFSWEIFSIFAIELDAKHSELVRCGLRGLGLNDHGLTFLEFSRQFDNYD